MSNKELKIDGALVSDGLMREVLDDINYHAQDYDNGAEGFISEVLTHGCQSGIVGMLISYYDTGEFYKKHKADITILVDMLDDTGLSVNELFGKQWDNHDPLVLDMYNQNLLAWFGYEETCRTLAALAGLDI